MFSACHPLGGVKLAGIGGCLSHARLPCRRAAPGGRASPAPTPFATSPLRTSRRDVGVACTTGVVSNAEAEQASSGNGVFWLCLTNAVMFLFQQLQVGFVKELYLYHAFPRWWQFLTCSFCHASWQHLSSNIFMLYIFGKAVEEEGGSFGVVMTYLVCAIGGAVAGYFALPKHSVSLGASAAVFGLFVVSVLTKLSWSAKKLLEAGILGQFVVQQLVSEIKMQAAGGAWVGGNQISHVAHLGGAAAGVLLVLLLSKLPE